MSRIYTRTGDTGTTKLVGCTEVLKDDPRVDCYGTLDELNSHLGQSYALLHSLKQSPNGLSTDGAETSAEELGNNIHRIQNLLFNAGSIIACEKEEMRKMLPAITEEHILWLEKSIDEMTMQLTPLKQFILPGGSLLASQIHIARTVCRRAERQCVSLIKTEPHLEVILKFLNRLSDWCFVAARFTNHIQNIPDQVWQK